MRALSINSTIDGYREELVESVQRLIRIKSVESEPKDGMPFGEGLNDALLCYLGMASDMGFRTENIDGYAGHVEWGNGDEIIGVLVHLDVVPEGDGWTHPPYSGEISENRIFGRGAIDDKGPAVSVLYGLKAIKDLGLDLKRRIRIIAGLDEESGWECMKHYFKHQPKPIAGFSPDAEFPIINSEKGILTFKLRQAFDEMVPKEAWIENITGGLRHNMVPEICRAVVGCTADSVKTSIKKNLDDFIKETGYRLEAEDHDGGLIITSYGLSAHGSTPEKGQNAIGQMLVFLSRLDLHGQSAGFIGQMAEKIGMETNGRSMGVELEDDISGKLTFNLGMIKVDRKQGELVINIRYPIKYTKDQVIAGIAKAIDKTGIEISDVSDNPPLYVPGDNFLVKQLKEVYSEATGQEANLISIGGGTYARAIENAVAFGPLFPGQPELAHQKDEHIHIDHLMEITKIYANAMYRLTR
jgi:succinyl-diaminopimelate desuccinylase